MKSSILIVEDDTLQREMLAELLDQRLDYQSVQAENGHEALKVLADEVVRAKIRLIIMDIDMPVMNGLEALQIIQKKYPQIPVIMLTGQKGLDNAVKCMKLGATDFLTKPYDIDRILVTIKNAIRLAKLSQEVDRLSQGTESHGFDQLIGSSEGLKTATSLGLKAASSDIPVLISGETGTGKEVFAKAIHHESDRAKGPFIAVNCGAIPSQLIESTLFGHEKGAFTGAVDQMKGKFREADGGTIFLDEVGELPLEAQVKLLRVLQQKEVEPVGAGHPVPVNVRILSATNRDLEEEVAKGLFREDLYFRLNVFPLKLPPLRARKKDVPLLANHFIERFSISDKLGVKKLSSASHKFLMEQHWQGNVRQLENTIHRAAVMSDGEVVTPEDLSTFVQSPKAEQKEGAEPATNMTFLTDDHGALKSMEEIEKDAIAYALQHFNHNITKASEALGLAKSTFYRKMKTYGLT